MIRLPDSPGSLDAAGGRPNPDPTEQPQAQPPTIDLSLETVQQAAREFGLRLRGPRSPGQMVITPTYSALSSGADQALFEGRTAYGAFMAYSDIGVGHPLDPKRGINQDGYLVFRRRDGTLFLVALDGMKNSGPPVNPKIGWGDLATYLVLRDGEQELRKGSNLRDLFLNAGFNLSDAYDLFCNEHDLSKEDRERGSHMGACVAGVEIGYSEKRGHHRFFVWGAGNVRVTHLSRDLGIWETVDETRATQQLLRDHGEYRNVRQADLQSGFTDTREQVTGFIKLSYGANDASTPFQNYGPFTLQSGDWLCLATDAIGDVIDGMDLGRVIVDVERRLSHLLDSPEGQQQIVKEANEALRNQVAEIVAACTSPDDPRLRVDNRTIILYRHF